MPHGDALILIGVVIIVPGRMDGGTRSSCADPGTPSGLKAEAVEPCLQEGLSRNAVAERSGFLSADWLAGCASLNRLLKEGRELRATDSRDLAGEHKIVCSMSATDCCRDKAMAESIFSTLKRNWISMTTVRQ